MHNPLISAVNQVVRISPATGRMSQRSVEKGARRCAGHRLRSSSRQLSGSSARALEPPPYALKAKLGQGGPADRT